ncbi:MAG: hypothetical protein HQK61_11510 [Desulfamplus sp.]|nr:hypothetical protein [Desulfamplus sp.]
MLTNINGVYRMGKVELYEQPVNIPDGSKVVVTFIEQGDVDLNLRGIARAEAGELRSRLSSFAQDWDNPEMNIYDNYDAYKKTI